MWLMGALVWPLFLFSCYLCTNTRYVVSDRVRLDLKAGFLVVKYTLLVVVLTFVLMLISVVRMRVVVTLASVFVFTVAVVVVL